VSIVIVARLDLKGGKFRNKLLVFSVKHNSGKVIKLFPVFIMERGFLSLKYLDSEWHKTAEGDLCIQQLHNQHEMSRKQFGMKK